MMHGNSASLAAALTAAALLGVRHGLDCDHIAALGDFVSIEKQVGHSIRLGLAYIAGHSLVIAILGSAAICMQLAWPATGDRWMKRAVGFTLVAFSIYIGHSLATIATARSLPWTEPGGSPEEWLPLAACSIPLQRWQEYSFGNHRFK